MSTRDWLKGCFAISLLLLTACGPSVVIENHAPYDIRTVFRHELGVSESGLSANTEIKMDHMIEGDWSITVIPNKEWIAHAKGIRDELSSQFANSDTLTDAQVEQVVQRLKDISRAIEQFEADNSEASCGSTVSEESSSGTATVSVSDDGKLIVVCK